MELEAFERAAALVLAQMPPTPQYRWPQLAALTGTKLWVKHENHTPSGAFKVRGSITYMDWLRRERPDVAGIVTATRGNHGQGQARAATAAGMIAKIFVPHGNSREKNEAMRSFGAELIEVGRDFDEAKEAAFATAEAEGLAFVPPYHDALVAGVGTYGLELMRAVPDLEAIYVPVGCGSGICSLIKVRDALGLDVEIIGVVAEGADCVKRSVEAGRLVATERAHTFADGMAVREPVAAAFEVYSRGAARIVSVPDEAIAEAMRHYFQRTHNVAEGAGAAPLAALMAEREAMAGRSVAVILCGGNVDSDVFAEVLAGGTPQPRDGGPRAG